MKIKPLTLSRRRPLSYRNQSIDLRNKTMDWFLYDNGLRLERVKCEGAITESELLKPLTSVNNDKSSVNDNITKEFYIKFWGVVKKPLCASM